MSVNPDTGPIPLSHTRSTLLLALENKAESTHFPYFRRALKIRKYLFQCCGTQGFGSPREADCALVCKGKCIKYTSNILSGACTCFLTAITLGCYAYVEYQGYKKDLERQPRKLTQVVPVND